MFSLDKRQDPNACFTQSFTTYHVNYFLLLSMKLIIGLLISFLANVVKENILIYLT